MSLFELADLKNEVEENDYEVIDNPLNYLELETSNAVEKEEPTDPLNDQELNDSEQQENIYLFNDEDIYIDEKSIDTSPIQIKPRNKRARIATEYHSKSGHEWSIKPVLDANLLDVINQNPKCKGPAHITTNPLESWHLLLDEQILSLIVKSTNEEIRKRKDKLSHQRPIDITELRAWIGLNYLCGIFRNSINNGPIEELWTQELGNIVFRCCMSYRRFEYLNDVLRFHPKSTIESTLSPLEPIFRIWEKFIINCRSYYSPSNYCAIDDHILSMTDPNCPYQFERNNEDSIGIRLVTLCDAKTLYMSNAIVSLEATPNTHDIQHLVSDIKTTNRIISISNELYMNIKLTKKLQQSKLATIGSISLVADEVPQQIATIKSNFKLYHESTQLHIYQKDKNIEKEIILTTGLSDKINPRLLYDHTSEVIQKFHYQARLYSTENALALLKSSWQLDFFYSLLNFAAINSWILLRLSDKGNTDINQRDFTRQLGLFLTQQHLKRRLVSKTGLTLLQKIQISELLGYSTEELLRDYATDATKKLSNGFIPEDKVKLPDGVVIHSKYTEKRTRCRQCARTTRTKCRSRCQQCLKPLCARHMIMRCNDCTGSSFVEENEKTTTKANNENSTIDLIAC